MPSERSSALSPEYALLGLLRLAPGHGYDVHRRLMRDLGAVWTIHQNQAYSILRRLQAAGFVHQESERAAGTRARRTLRLTPAGQRRFDAWLRTPTGPSVRALRVDFLSRLYFARQIDAHLADDILAQQIDVTRQALSRLRVRTGRPRQADSLDAYSVDLRVRQLQLALEWLEALRRREGGRLSPRTTKKGTTRREPHKPPA